jgi:hypothetical protein
MIDQTQAGQVLASQMELEQDPSIARMGKPTRILFSVLPQEQTFWPSLHWESCLTDEITSPDLITYLDETIDVVEIPGQAMLLPGVYFN